MCIFIPLQNLHCYLFMTGFKDDAGCLYIVALVITVVIVWSMFVEQIFSSNLSGKKIFLFPFFLRCSLCKGSDMVHGGDMQYVLRETIVCCFF